MSALPQPDARTRRARSFRRPESASLEFRSSESSEESACLDAVMDAYKISNVDMAEAFGCDEKLVRLMRQNEADLPDNWIMHVPRWIRRAVRAEQARREGLTVGRPAALALAIEAAVTVAVEEHWPIGDLDERLKISRPPALKAELK